ncbi:MAG: hypothetical protein ACJAS1_004733 [Oleiphilaceae bacterium]|jgi:hypothetical protein
MKILFIVLALTSFLVACESDAERARKEAATKHLENKTAIITREAVSRNMLSRARRYVAVCDLEYNLSWCEGYFSAVYASIESNGSEVCVPRHNRSNKVIFESAWAIVKDSLNRLPEDTKVKFYDSTVSALTKGGNCAN